MKQQPRPVKLRCLYCNAWCNGKYYHAGKITSYLNTHIFRQPSCYEHYFTNNLIWGNGVLLTLIVNGADDQQSAKKRRIVDTSNHQFTTLTPWGWIDGNSYWRIVIPQYMHGAINMVGRKGIDQVVVCFVDFESNFRVQVVYFIIGGCLFYWLPN